MYRPYPKFARTAIQQACDMERQKTNELAKNYVSFHGGSDPLDENGHLVKGMATLENARWIFENKLNCRPTSEWSADSENKYEQGFTRLVRIGGLGVTETYAKWGVIYQVTSRTIAPYITRLAQVTGLNADSLKSLDVDDFVESHELTQRPYLRYWKERSGGGKVLHLDLMYADWTWLTRAQSIEVRKIFSEVVYLTRHIRELAEGAVKERLFIYESQKQSEFRKVKSFENSTLINNVMNQFARDHNLKTEGGEDLNISASRLRPSLVADLVEQGVSIREIQVILGHGSHKTTINYLDKLEFNKTAREVNSKALTEIHKGTIIQDAKSATKHKPSTPGTSSSPVIIKTGLVSCRDALNPPDEITKLPSYKKGSKCSLLNKCLSCSNSIITVSNLPDLFAMQWDYISIMSTSNVAETPYGTVIRENLEVLNSILTPSEHGFTAEQLEEARRLAEHIVTNPMIEAVSL
ncbi:tyrosine-type recombinase/integrase [Pseudomonas shahriarae]|uniref:tyrosine-type recombinase/integrase n=2 Tax=Pseudomonas TaxID=286 RepID=UPI0023606DBE|nr:tyrosine-type recombinase/integrase [Pseudomonas shahriarae]MDD1032467.1 tyrosine-type recombinase/integrase [Pseudomonas shahriarae]